MKPGWTVEQTETLKGFLSANMSGNQISRMMGMTRSAVMGRAHRLGLSVGGGAAAPMSQEERLLRRRAAQRQRRGSTAIYDGPVRTKSTNGHHPKAEPIDPNTSLADFNAAIPVEQRKTIIQLSQEHCRFPLWGDDDPSRFYCGHPSADVSEGKPFCAAHSHFAYNGKTNAKPWLPGRVS